MPKQYEAMKARFKGEGMSDRAAKRKAARIYNANRGDKPAVTGHHKSQHRKGRFG